MQNKVRNSIIALICCLCPIWSWGTHYEHLSALRSKFPYGLLGDDYGILGMSDLAINACRLKAEPFPPKPFVSPYEYWKCFERKSISLKCASSGVPDQHEGVMGLVTVKASADHVIHDYMERRPWPIRECRSFLKDLTLIMDGQRYVCISGSFIENEIDKTGKKTTSWLFERLKTSKGCEGRGCDFTKEIKKDYCPELDYKF